MGQSDPNSDKILAKIIRARQCGLVGFHWLAREHPELIVARRFSFEVSLPVAGEYVFTLGEDEPTKYDSEATAEAAAKDFFVSLSEEAQDRVRITLIYRDGDEMEWSPLRHLDIDGWRTHVRYGLWYVVPRYDGPPCQLYVGSKPIYATLSEATHAGWVCEYKLSKQERAIGVEIHVYRRNERLAAEDPDRPVDEFVRKVDDPGFGFMYVRPGVLERLEF